MRRFRWVGPALLVLATVSAVAEESDLEVAARSVIQAFEGGDGPGVDRLAAASSPDPWRVADLVLARGRPEAAAAFARAARGRDVEGLARYVDAWRPGADDAAARKALREAEDAQERDEAAAALASLGDHAGTPGSALGIQIAHLRGHLLGAVGRVEEGVRLLRAAEADARRVGWWRRAARILWSSAQYAEDPGSAVEVWTSLARLNEERADVAGTAEALVNLVEALRFAGRTREAAEGARRLLTVLPADGVPAPFRATALVSAAESLKDVGDYVRAAELANEAAVVAERAGEQESRAWALRIVGTIHDIRGDYDAAIDPYRKALEIERARGDAGPVALTLTLLATAQRNRGAVGEALRLAEEARDIAHRAEAPDEEAAALSTLAGIHAARGSYAKALSLLEQGVALLNRSDAYVQDYIAALCNLATLYLEIGDPSRGGAWAQRALEPARSAGVPQLEARARLLLGRAHEDLERWDEAEAEYEASARLEESFAPLESRAYVQIDRVNVALQRGDVPAARERIDRAVGDLEAAPLVPPRVRSLVRAVLAHVLEKQGDLPAAERAAGEAVAAAEEDGAPVLRAESLHRLAHVRLGAGNAASAVALCRQAVALLGPTLGGHSEEHGATLRGRFAPLHATGVRAARALRRTDEAFSFLEAGRAGALLESLGKREILQRWVLPVPLAHAEAAAHTAVRNAKQALEAARESKDRAAVQTRRAAYDAALDELQRVVESVQREAKGAAAVLHPPPPSLAEVRAHLGANEVLVEYGPADAASFAWVVSKEGVREVDLDLRGAGDGVFDTAVFSESGEAAADASVAAIRGRLVDPLALPDRARRVIVCPPPEWAHVPFALLFQGRSVSFVPSSATLLLLRDTGQPRGEGVLALGNPTYAADGAAPSLHGSRAPVSLPASGEEAAAVGDTVLLEKEASEAGLRRAIATRPRWRAVHLACHGLLHPERAMLSGLLLAPDAEHDGILTALDVFRLRLPADLAVLSACSTGGGRAVAGEGVLGLTRAFLFAGPPRVIVSLWDVDDRATAELMKRFYAGWKQGEAAADALRAAQEHVRSRPAWSHPKYWAAWALWGLPE